MSVLGDTIQQIYKLTVEKEFLKVNSHFSGRWSHCFTIFSLTESLLFLILYNLSGIVQTHLVFFSTILKIFEDQFWSVIAMSDIKFSERLWSVIARQSGIKLPERLDQKRRRKCLPLWLTQVQYPMWRKILWCFSQEPRVGTFDLDLWVNIKGASLIVLGELSVVGSRSS